MAECLLRAGNKFNSIPQQHQIQDEPMAALILTMANSILLEKRRHEIFILNLQSVAAVGQQTQLIVQHIHAAPGKLLAVTNIALKETLQRHMSEGGRHIL